MKEAHFTQAMEYVSDAARESLSTLSPEQIASLLSGDLVVTIRFEKKQASPKPDGSKVQMSPEVLSAAAEQLFGANDRETGMAILAANFSTKELLVQLGRELDVAVSAKDSIPKLKERIIEATIGFRLRSQAIQSSAA